MIRVLVYGYNGTTFGGIEKVQTEYIKAITAHHQDITFDILVAGDTCHQEHVFSEMGCRVLYYPVRRKNVQAYKTCMRRIFSETQYDAVWCNVSGLTNIDILILAKQHGVPTRIIHAHTAHLMWGNPLMRVLVPLMHYRNKRLLSRFATHYWACSHKAGAFMFPATVQDRVYVVKNAIDITRFHPNNTSREVLRRELQAHDLVIAHTARLSPEKNQVFLLHVMQKVVEQRPDAKLLMIGDGELRSELETVTEQLQLTKNVIFTGFQNNIQEWLSAADIFVLPSVAEGLGLSAIEAQACGLPCLLSSMVPTEADISGAVRFVSLDASAEYWANAIFDLEKDKIADPLACIEQSGYNIDSAANAVYNIFKGD